MVFRDYEYVGGGYFREKGVPVGKTAKTIHAPELFKAMLEEIDSLEAHLYDYQMAESEG